MTETHEPSSPWKCVFCRMSNERRVLRAPLCAICWEQVNDFIWVSFVQIALLAVGAINGLFFVIKHRVRPILSRFTEIA